MGAFSMHYLIPREAGERLWVWLSRERTVSDRLNSAIVVSLVASAFAAFVVADYNRLAANVLATHFLYWLFALMAFDLPKTLWGWSVHLLLYSGTVWMMCC